jgi:hypothetical protein
MKSSIRKFGFSAVGFFLLVLGFYLVKTISSPAGIMQALPYLCIGVGCGIAGHSIGNFISRKALKNSPELRRQMEIDKKDERNVIIANSAKAKAYDRMIFIYGALMLSFALMGVDMAAVLLLVFAYLLVVGFGLYYRFKLEKEM